MTTTEKLEEKIKSAFAKLGIIAENISIEEEFPWQWQVSAASSMVMPDE